MEHPLWDPMKKVQFVNKIVFVASEFEDHSCRHFGTPCPVGSISPSNCSYSTYYTCSKSASHNFCAFVFSNLVISASKSSMSFSCLDTFSAVKADTGRRMM